MRTSIHAFLMTAALSLHPALTVQQELKLDWLQGGHVGRVCGLSFSPSGDFLATVSSFDHSAKRWSVPDGRLQETLKAWRKLDKRPMTVAWSPAGDEIAFGHMGGTVEILDLDEGTTTTLELKSPIRSLAWGQLGKVLIVGRDEPKVLLVTDGAVTGDLLGNLGSIGDLAVSSDGLFVAGGGSDTRAYYWKLSSAHLEFTLAGHERFSHVAISPNGGFLVTTDGSKVRIWSTSDGSLLSTYDETLSGAHEIEFIDDETIVYAADYGRARWRDITTGELVRDLDHALEITGPAMLAYSPATEVLALGGRFGRLQLRNARTGERLHQLVPDAMFFAERITASPDGARLVANCGRRIAHVRDAVTGNLLSTLSTPLVVPAVPPSIDEMPPENAIFGTSFSADSLYVYGACQDGCVRKWDATSGAELASFQVSEEYVAVDVAVFHDGSLALCGLGDKTARVIQLSDGAEVQVLSGHDRFLRAVAVSPNEELFATGDNSGRVLVWTASSGQLRFDLPEHRNSIRRLDFSADGSMLASAGADAVVKIWSTADGSLLRELRHPAHNPSRPETAYSATFAPAGSKIVTISSLGVCFWDASDGSSIDWTVPESAFARDCAWIGDKLVFGRGDGTVLMVSVP